jgi:hypothetical protein
MYLEIAAFICSVIYFKKIKGTPLLWLVPFLLLMVSTEFAGMYMRKILHVQNVKLYNITIPIEYAFYTFLFSQLMTSQLFKKIALATLAFLICFSVINILFIQGFSLLATNNLKVGNIIMIFLSCLALVDVFNNDIETSITQIPLFWLAVGVLIFNAGEILYLLFFNTLLKHGWDKTADIFNSINNKLIYVLYSCIILSILCTKKLPKKI